MIGIIGAMSIEVDGLIAKLTDVSAVKIGMLEFHCGKIEGRDVVVACCGAGKVNAAACAQAMILRFRPDVIINTGVAGGLAQGMKVCDCVVADGVCQHDYDTTAIGEPLGFVSLINRVVVECDKDTVQKLRASAEKVCGDRVFGGIVATGDCFVSSAEKVSMLRNTFSAAACEMEGGAVGHVCCINSVPFAVLRTISDGGDDGAHLSFEEFSRLAAEASVRIILDFIKR